MLSLNDKKFHFLPAVHLSYTRCHLPPALFAVHFLETGSPCCLDTLLLDVDMIHMLCTEVVYHHVPWDSLFSHFLSKISVNSHHCCPTSYYLSTIQHLSLSGCFHHFHISVDFWLSLRILLPIMLLHVLLKMQDLI